MRRILAALPVAFWSGAALASFHPVEDRRYRYDTVETRTADGVVRRFHASRSVVFHRTADGYDASVTLDAVDQQAGGDVGRMFLAATGALLHRTLQYRLDINGTVLEVVDADATIALIASAIERMDADRKRSGDAQVLASPLRTMPPERKAAMLRSILTPLIAGASAERPPGQRKIALPSRPPLAPGTALAGVETVSRNPAGIVTIDLRADGGIDTAAPADAHGRDIAAPLQAPAATIHTVRNVDPVTGLIRDSRDTSETRVGDGETLHRTQIDTVVTLQLSD